MVPTRATSPIERVLSTVQSSEKLQALKEHRTLRLKRKKQEAEDQPMSLTERMFVQPEKS